jgi:hypothetical protein
MYLIKLRQISEFELVCQCLTLNKNAHVSIDNEIERWLLNRDYQISLEKIKKHLSDEIKATLERIILERDIEGFKEESLIDGEYMKTIVTSPIKIHDNQKRLYSLFLFHKALDLHSEDIFGNRALNSIDKSR